MEESKVRLSSIFQSEEQEEIFARCSRDSMSSRTRLICKEEPIKGHNYRFSSIFSTKEQEELFAKCAQETMFRYMNDETAKKKTLKK